MDIGPRLEKAGVEQATKVARHIAILLELLWRTILAVSITLCLTYSLLLPKDMAYIREKVEPYYDNYIEVPRLYFDHCLPYNALQYQAAVVGATYLDMSTDIDYFLANYDGADQETKANKLRKRLTSVKQDRDTWNGLFLARVYPAYGELLDLEVELYEQMVAAMEGKAEPGETTQLFSIEPYSEKTLSLGKQVTDRSTQFAVITYVVEGVIVAGVIFGALNLVSRKIQKHLSDKLGETKHGNQH